MSDDKGMTQGIDSVEKSKKVGCCAPTSSREPQAVAVNLAMAGQPSQACQPSQSMLAHMARLPGGAFLMGTENPEGFPLDGEGPVRAVTVEPFLIDIHPVTNALFQQFVSETGYRTEAERFGWSFVFWSHIPTERFRDLVEEDTVAGAPWGCKVRGAQRNC